MRRALIVLLVIGMLIGTFAAIEGVSEEQSLNKHTDFSGDEGFGGDSGNPAPCGGDGGGTGGGGGIPG